MTTTAQIDFWQQTTGPYGGTVRALAITSNGDFYAGTSGGGLFRSKNNGDSWSKIDIPSNYVGAIAINSDGHIFIGTSLRGVYRSMDNGQTWNQINTGLTNTSVRSLAILSEGEAREIFAGKRAAVSFGRRIMAKPGV
jgi:ligand-binding sensor domain-containing protein